MTPFEEFMNPEVSQWTFVKPNPSKDFAIRMKKKTESQGNILFTVYTPCFDDTGNLYIQGFVQTFTSVDDQALINLFGRAMHTPCPTEEDENPTLTEILMDRSVREFGDTTKYKMKAEINSFKQDADAAMDGAVTEMYVKQPDFFQRHRHLVLRYLQLPSQSPKFGYPESFSQDADMAMMRVMGTAGEKHPDLFRDHPNAVIRHLVS